MANGFNPLTYEEYSGQYYTQPYAAYTNQLRPVSGLPPLPPSINVSSVLDPAGPATQQEESSSGFGIPKLPTSMFNGLDSPIFGNTMLSRGIDSIGTSLGITGPTAMGPTTTGAAGYATGISKNFTGASALSSFAGNQAAKILGLGDGEYANIGGTVGGAIGTAIGGPIGGGIGSFLGTTVGGLFGGGKPNPASVVGSNQGITAAGTFTEGGTIRSKHAGNDFAANMRNMVDKFNSSIHEQTNLDLSKTINTLYAGYDVNHGPGFISLNGYYRTDHEHHNPNNFFTFDPNNQQSMIQAFKNYGSKLLQETGQEFSPEQVSQIVNTAVRSLGTQESTAASRPNIERRDIGIAQRTEQGNKFTEFLKQYNQQYNQKAVA